MDPDLIEKMATSVAETRDSGGRMFRGSGGGAGHASHAVSILGKQIGVLHPNRYVSELSARVNDDGWDTSYVNWLKVNKFCEKDALFVFSVGGGVREEISVNLVNCIKLANERAKVFGVVGRDGGFTKKSSDLVVVVPTMDESLVTPHTEGWQAVLWHLLVSHPKVIQNEMKWESTK